MRMENEPEKNRNSSGKFVKGLSGNPSGKPIGAKNKATQQGREAIARFVDGNAERLTEWLDAIAAKDPKDAFSAFMSVVEYHIPKLARSELTGADGKDLPPQQIIVNVNGVKKE